jgi:hypothetical protein
MRRRHYGEPGWRPRPHAIAAWNERTVRTDGDAFHASCLHESGHAVIGRSLGLEIQALWVNCSTSAGGVQFGKHGCGRSNLERMLVTIAGVMAMRKGGFASEEHRASTDRQALEFFAQNDRQLIAIAELRAAELVEKHWEDICRLSDYLVRRRGGALDGETIEALLAGRPIPVAPTLTRGPALQTRELPASRLIAKPIGTVQAAGKELGELWRCSENGQVWFEAFLVLPPGEGKRRVGKRFASKAEAAKALTAATARKAA